MKSCKPPDPHPTTPRAALPPGACDAHCHVFGPADRFPYAPERSYTPPDAPVAALRALHATLGVSRAVIVQASCHGTDNRAMLDAIASSDGAYRGIAIVGGNVTGAELAALDRGGVRGVRFNFVAHLGGAPDLEVFDRTLDRLDGLGWHVVLHLDAEDILTYADRIRRIRVPFVIDHMGRVKAAGGLDQKPFKMLLELMRNPLAWVKVCGPERVSSTGKPFDDAIPFARRLLEAAPERVLWGTDWPHPNIAGDMPNDGALVDLFMRVSDDAGLRHRVLVDNPTRLYWS
ncbi:MAG: amidohydrolase family protein [Proteobacteria bacterium]|nr:amidohydrolase family protein [Pseudomonadota bacterium]